MRPPYARSSGAGPRSGVSTARRPLWSRGRADRRPQAISGARPPAEIVVHRPARPAPARRRARRSAGAHGPAQTCSIGAHVDQTDPVAEAQARDADLVQFFLGDPQGYKGPEIRYAGGADGLRGRRRGGGRRPLRPRALHHQRRHHEQPDPDPEPQAAPAARRRRRRDRRQGPDRARRPRQQGRRPGEGLRQLAQGRRGHRPQAPAADREHRRRRQRDDPLPRPDRPGLGRDLRAPRAFDMVGFCLDTCHAHAGGNDLDTVVEDVVEDHRPDRPGALPTTAATSSTPAPTGTPTSGRARSTPTCSPRSSATPAPRWSARRPAAPSEHRADFAWLRERLLTRPARSRRLAPDRPGRRPLASGRDSPPDRPHDHARASTWTSCDRTATAVGELPADPRVGRGEERVAARVDRLVRRPDATWSAPAWCSTASCRRSSATSPTCPRARSSTGTPTTCAPGSTPMVRHLQAGRRVRRPDGPAGGDPPLGRRRGEGRASPTTRVRRLGDVPPDRAVARPAPAWSRSCRSSAGGRRRVEGGFAAGQPQYNFQIPLRDADGEPRTEDDVLKGMNQQWRRNIKKADKAGVEVTARHARRTCQAFHDLYAHTAERDHFTPRPLAYFQTMFTRAAGRGAGPDPALPRPPRGRPGRRHDAGSGSAGTRGTPTAPPPPRSATCAAPTPCSGR